MRTESERQEAGDKEGGKKTERWIEGEMEEVLGRNLVIELNEFGHGTPSQVYLSNKQKTAETVKLGRHFLILPLDIMSIEQVWQHSWLG